MTQIFKLERVPTATGTMLVVTDDQDRLRAVDWAEYETRMRRLFRTQYKGQDVQLVEHAGPTPARRALEAYFAGDLSAIEGLAVETGGTDFQRQLWKALRSIPAGETSTYGALAAKLGRPSASRAIGAANGANPIGIVVPCHRVIGANSTLTGYAGGLKRKQWLLEHERAHAA